MNADAVIDYIVDWLNNYLRQSGMNGFVVGVSGGIDSAVTSTLCARTGQPVTAMNMPIFQNPGQVALSEKHIAWLTEKHVNATGKTVDLTPVFSTFQDVLPEGVGDDLTLANTRSRLRMVTLYAMATHHRMLVAGTGNKVEDFGVGFYTKYGDGGVDLSPIADLVKTEVYALGETLGVIQEIREAAPTDGLWADDRTDESQIGATYQELEWAMAVDAGRKAVDDLSERQQQVLEIFRSFNRANRHKMESIPVCIIPDTVRHG